MNAPFKKSDKRYKVDIVGKKIGRLKIIKRFKSGKYIRYKCKCDCGKIKNILSGTITAGKVKSCGCYRIEATIKNHTTHKRSCTKTYYVWNGMIQRCTNIKSKMYKYYGQRGIKVCARWLDFSNFLEDMGEKPSGLSIDRINNDKGYSRTNCRWISAKKQNENKRTKNGYNLYKLTLEQVKKIREAYKEGFSLNAIAKKFKVTHTTISNIINKKTWK